MLSPHSNAVIIHRINVILVYTYIKNEVFYSLVCKWTYKRIGQQLDERLGCEHDTHFDILLDELVVFGNVLLFTARLIYNYSLTASSNKDEDF